MKILDEGKCEEISESLEGMEEIFCEEEDVETPYTRKELSLKEGGFTDDDCEQTSYFNAHPGALGAIDQLGPGAPMRYIDERKERINQLLDFYISLYDSTEVLAFNYNDESFWEFESKDEYVKLMEKSIKSEYTMAPLLWEGEKLTKFEEEFYDNDNPFISVYLPKLKSIIVGDYDFTHHLFCWRSSAINQIMGLCSKHDIYVYDPEL